MDYDEIKRLIGDIRAALDSREIPYENARADEIILKTELLPQLVSALISRPEVFTSYEGDAYYPDLLKTDVKFDYSEDRTEIAIRIEVPEVTWRFDTLHTI